MGTLVPPGSQKNRQTRNPDGQQAKQTEKIREGEMGQQTEDKEKHGMTRKGGTGNRWLHTHIDTETEREGD